MRYVVFSLQLTVLLGHLLVSKAQYAQILFVVGEWKIVCTEFSS